MPTTIQLRVRATPRAPSATLRRRPDGSLNARVTQPPTDGRANRALIELLAESLDLRQGDVSIERGTRGRDRTIAVRTSNLAGLLAALDRLETVT